MSEARLLTGGPQSGSALVREAIGWHAGLEPTPVLACLHATLARAFIIDDDFDGAMLAATEAQSLGRDLDLPEVVTDAMTSLARLDDFAGDPQRSMSALRDVISRSRAASDVPAELRGLHQLARVQVRMEQPREALATLLEAIGRSDATGYRTNPYAFDSRVLASHYALLVGDWPVAHELLDPGDLVFPPLMDASLTAMRMVRDAGLGRPEVLDTLPVMRPLWSRDMFVAIHTAGVAIDVYGASGDVDRMLTAYDDVVDTVISTWGLADFDARIRLSALALGHLGSAVLEGRALGDAGK